MHRCVLCVHSIDNFLCVQLASVNWDRSGQYKLGNSVIVLIIHFLYCTICKKYIFAHFVHVHKNLNPKIVLLIG